MNRGSRWGFEPRIKATGYPFLLLARHYWLISAQTPAPLKYIYAAAPPPRSILFIQQTYSMAVKRRATTALGGPKKRPWARDLTHGRSVRDQAEEYRLGTAIFRVADLTPKWLTGHNRNLNKKQVSTLCAAFERQQLRRESVGNRLRVLCTEAEFERMRAFLEQAGEPTIETSSSWPKFRDWVKVNGHPAELMAGQHRVAALQAFYQKEGRLEASSDPDPLCWVCDIYNRG